MKRLLFLFMIIAAYTIGCTVHGFSQKVDEMKSEKIVVNVKQGNGVYLHSVSQIKNIRVGDLDTPITQRSFAVDTTFSEKDILEALAKYFETGELPENIDLEFLVAQWKYLIKNRPDKDDSHDLWIMWILFTSITLFLTVSWTIKWYKRKQENKIDELFLNLDPYNHTDITVVRDRIKQIQYELKK